MTAEARVNSWSLLALAVLRSDSFENVQLARHARLNGIAHRLGRNGIRPADMRKAEKDNNEADAALYRRRGEARA